MYGDGDGSPYQKQYWSELAWICTADSTKPAFAAKFWPASNCACPAQKWDCQINSIYDSNKQLLWRHAMSVSRRFTLLYLTRVLCSDICTTHTVCVSGAVPWVGTYCVLNCVSPSQVCSRTGTDACRTGPPCCWMQPFQRCVPYRESTWI